ncbi:hypothetical protein RRG08_022909 [Elysia crispata]|uniref:Uncharacterized protein n=1 Tax=Elysia crispata TaxID=231223 RepID=A0AAE0XN47_9GAST|nr:hypothetical protein RRG08_022909 [Elysia crispata]
MALDLNYNGLNVTRIQESQMSGHVFERPSRSQNYVSSTRRESLVLHRLRGDKNRKIKDLSVSDRGRVSSCCYCCGQLAVDTQGHGVRAWIVSRTVAEFRAAATAVVS